MKIDLCRLFGVEEGEEFKIDGYEAIYFILNGYLYLIDIDSAKKISFLSINDVVGKKIIKLPKKKEFTDDELCILRNIDKKYKLIAKDSSGDVWIYADRPQKGNMRWKCFCDCKLFDVIKNSLFTEIKWEDEEPIYIDDYVER